MQQLEFQLNAEFVELNQLLKLTGVCDSGGAGKALVAEGVVYVDGQLELRKTAKIRVGQVVSLGDVQIQVINWVVLYIVHNVIIPEREIEFSAMRAQGAGGQNVNKVSSAMHLRFDIVASSLPEQLKQRLLQLKDQRITKDGVVVIKAQEFRNQEQNRNEALRRLKAMVQLVAVLPKKRIATKPSRSAQRKRVDSKTKRGMTKSLRGKITE